MSEDTYERTEERGGQPFGGDVIKLDGGELIYCPNCKKPNLHMQTTELRSGLIVGHEGSGIFADYYCDSCDRMSTLGFYNQALGNGRMAARINWVKKV